MMNEALADVPVSSFNTAAEDIVQGESISVPSVSGMSVEQARRALRDAQLDPVVSEDQVYAEYAGAGSVAYTYPGTGAAVYPGQRVVVYVSAGAPPAQPEPGPEPSDGGGTTLGGRNDQAIAPPQSCPTMTAWL